MVGVIVRVGVKVSGWIGVRLTCAAVTDDHSIIYGMSPA